LREIEVIEELEAIIGPELTKRMIDKYIGKSFYIPKSVIINREYQRIRDDFKKGVSLKKLALRYGYTERHIRNIIKERLK